MFSPATKKTNFSSAKKNTSLLKRSSFTGNDSSPSPVTPLRDSNAILNRPSTGTPAPWASRLSVLARIPPVKRSDKVEDVDLIQPVYVGEFPPVVRDEQQAMLQEKHAHGDMCISGGMDKETSLAWVICRNKFFVWSYLSPTASRRCVVLDIPSSTLAYGDINKSSSNSNNWLVCVINWDSLNRKNDRVVAQCNSAGIILCNRRTRTLIYWPDIYCEGRSFPVTSHASMEESEAIFFPSDGKATPNKQRQHTKHGASSSGSSFFNSLIATPIPGGHHTCIALACSSSGELWQFLFNPSAIQRKNLSHMISTGHPGSVGIQSVGSKGYPRSLTWNIIDSAGEPKRQFLLLRDSEIQCFAVKLTPDYIVSKLWSHEIIGTDGDLGIQKDLAGQKQIWPLDLQVESDGKVITILIAIFCKDRITSSSYTEYSLLTMQYRSGVNVSAEFVKERVLEKKAPIQVMIPKARVEDEEFLFSMRLKIGGKPAGSVIILSGDGTATVSHYWRNSTRLYQFHLPYDAGKVLDASVFPSSDDGEDGAWAVLTEKAGVWAIPERAVLLGGVEPPERSLSSKGSSNERSSQEERKNFSLGGNIPPRRASSEAWDAGDRQRAPLTGIARRNAQDEESEALLNQLFHDFLISGQVDGALDKLRNSGAFERDGEMNVFARTSKSIVDTLAKHWTTMRGAEIVALSIVSTQLLEKQHKHQKFLQFLALSKCHEELCSRQRQSLQIIMEHGEKLAGIIQLRELQNIICQSHANVVGSSRSSSETPTAGASGALWDLIQLVGERARRKTVLLMDRDNVEVFYSKVSDIEEIFYCLERQLDYLISGEMSFTVQFQRACELSNACVSILQTSMNYRNEHHLWYPSPEGLTPWYCQNVVRSGLWSIAAFMLQLVNETSSLNHAAKSDFYPHLEVLSEVLLDSYSGAITAKVERNEDHKSLLDEYWKSRDALLDSLYMQVKGFFQAKISDSREGTEDQNGELLRQLSSSLFPIAKRHESYQTLWSICCDLNDLNLLRSLMHESMGPKGGFCNFVFNQMYDNKQYFKLMRLGEEFQEELAIFLKPHLHLRWLHEIFLNQFCFASESLHTLAFSEEDGLASASEKPDSCDTGKTLAARKRFLNLSKIAAMAGKDADYSIKVKRIEADLKILKLQEEILKVLPDNEEKQKIGHRLLPPVDLIDLCLKSRNRILALLAFDVFAWTSLSFLKCNSSLLEECWRNAANQDDWEIIYQMSLAEGWSDEETLRVLGETILFQASSRCYGPEAKTFEGSFDEVLPLRQERTGHSYARDIDSSVEVILMQHKDFPDAGKLMLTAIMLGSVHGGKIVNDGPSPME